MIILFIRFHYFILIIKSFHFHLLHHSKPLYIYKYLLYIIFESKVK
jgi:hypothetical protein